ARAVARAVKRRAAQGAGTNDEEEVRLLALIAKENYKNTDQCKDKVEKYCKTLTDAGLNPEKVHEKLKDFCNNGKQNKKCQDLQTKVTGKCTSFQQKLKTALTNPSDD
ncbi:uncharacterized protein T551_00001, partial [Pneumocystis jirovecii RU7]